MLDNIIIAENTYKQKIAFDPQDHIGKAILQKGLYDKKALVYIEKILAKIDNPIVFDIGANIGNHALVMSRQSKQVYLFEPQPYNNKLLQKTMALNKITNWTIIPIGLADEENILTLYKNLDGNNGASTFIPELRGENFLEENLKVRIGDNIVNELGISAIDFIKIDVEGYEAKVIAGLKSSITQYKPVIIIEWNNQITKKQFEEYNLFNDLFRDYSIKALISNKDPARWHKKICRRIRRFFYKKLVKGCFIASEFNKILDYQHVLFIPQAKACILNGL